MIQRIARLFLLSGIGMCILCTLLSHRVLRLELFNPVTIVVSLAYIRMSLLILTLGICLYAGLAIYKSRKYKVSLLHYLFKLDLDLPDDNDD